MEVIIRGTPEEIASFMAALTSPAMHAISDDDLLTRRMAAATEGGDNNVDATKPNFKIADQILTILAKENCTVLQAAEILSYVSSQIRERSTVQFREGDLVNGADTVD